MVKNLGVLDSFLLYVSAIAKLPVISLLLFWIEGQDGVEFI
jgi:hypothetical protein